MSALAVPSHHTDRELARRSPERVPVSACCPACGRSRLIYTTVRPTVTVTLTCPSCRGTTSEPWR